MATERRAVLQALAALALTAAGAGARPALGQGGTAQHADRPGMPMAGGGPGLPGQQAIPSVDMPLQDGIESGPAPAAPDATPAGQAVYVTARRGAVGHEAVVLDLAGTDRRVVPLEDRGHGAAFDAATGRIVVFGRQPGFFAVGFDLAGSAPVPLPLAADRHFFGHGVFIDGGQRLLATENDYVAGRGVLGIYDARPGAGYRRLGEFATGGVGPHEVLAIPGTTLVVVANGGLLTHPDYDKIPLNLATMQPSLAYLDTRTGELVERVTLPDHWHQLSIRHMALDARQRVWFGCQFMGAPGDLPPLVGYHARWEAPALLDLPQAAWRPYRNYIGSVAADGAGEVIAVSSPLGHRVGYVDARRGTLLGDTLLHDGCGVAPAGAARDFLLSSGGGELAQATPGEPARKLRADAALAWDNHLRRFAAA